MMCGHLDVSIGRTKNTAMREKVIIGHDECRKLINDGYYVHVTHGIHGALDEVRHITFTLNERSDRKAYTYRSVTEDGQCTADSGSNFRSGYTNMSDIVSGTTWAYYEDTEFEIYVGEIEGVTHQASNSVRFGHLTANADDRNLTDSTLGYIILSPENNLLFVSSWACTSSPITTSYLSLIMYCKNTFNQLMAIV